MSAKQYDVVVLGGGTGGYVAAIRAAQLGKKVAIVERDKLGGTCLHRGCIPSKAFLRSAEVYHTMKNSEAYGIHTDEIQLQFHKVSERKNAIVNKLHQGVQFLMNKHKIDLFYGNGRVIGPSIFSPRSGAVAVEMLDGEAETLLPQHLIIATGSSPRTLPGLEPDGQWILDSDHATQLEELPESVLIVGGGVIGMEWASMFIDFGVEVTVVEAGTRILPHEDEEVSQELERLLTRRGVRILTDAKVLPETLEKSKDQASISVEHQGQLLRSHASKIIISVGRSANCTGIGLENTDVRVENGFIKVNEQMQTTEPHIYAIGDVNGGLQLAHVAIHEGMLAAEHLAGERTMQVQQHMIARCVYTRPEVASVGLTETAARERGLDVKNAKYPFSIVGKALVYGESEGFVKVVADSKTGDILGVHMIGPHVTDQISEAALAQWLDASVWETSRLIHPHPTLSEALGEALLTLEGRSASH